MNNCIIIENVTKKKKQDKKITRHNQYQYYTFLVSHSETKKKKNL